MDFNNLKVYIAGIELKNPVMTASGTFGSGKEYSEFFELSRLGGIITKGVSAEPWKGNKPPRVAETYGGMLNSVGLQNPGAEMFIKNDIPFLKKADTNIIVNICGRTEEEYCAVAEMLDNPEFGISMFELNISCPNIKEGGISFGTNAIAVENVVKKVKGRTKKPIMVKLSPNVTSITDIAKAAESGGADAISLINTLLGMKIDIERRKPVLANVYGGLSGPCIMPVAVRMVNQVFKAVKVPVIGMGGICTGRDAIEFIMAGARAVCVGTANFRNPHACIDILQGMSDFMESHSVKHIDEIYGIV